VCRTCWHEHKGRFGHAIDAVGIIVRDFKYLLYESNYTEGCVCLTLDYSQFVACMPCSVSTVCIQHTSLYTHPYPRISYFKNTSLPSLSIEYRFRYNYFLSKMSLLVIIFLVLNSVVLIFLVTISSLCRPLSSLSSSFYSRSVKWRNAMVLYYMCMVRNSVMVLGCLADFISLLLLVVGHAVAQLVEALCYKPEGRGFDSRWCYWNFSLT
jgi:hypothetical protein